MLKRELFGTPVLEVELPDAEKFVKGVMLEANRIPRRTNGTSFNLWDHGGPVITELKGLFEKYGSEISPFGPVRTRRAWMHADTDPQSTLAHWHRVFMIGVFWVAVPEGAGADLLLQDPRGVNDWHRLTENGRDCRAHQRIEAVPGKMVLFPGYVIHAIQPHFTDQLRMSVATNLELVKDIG